MINLLIGMLIGTYFAKYTRPVFERIWAWVKVKYDEFQASKPKGE